jgi:hypothetical protein
MGRALHNATFFRQARKAKILTGGIHWVFRGLKFEVCRRITGHEVKRQRSYGSCTKLSWGRAVNAALRVADEITQKCFELIWVSFLL